MAEIREDKKALQAQLEKIGGTIAGVMPERWVRIVLGYFVEAETQISHLQIWFLQAGDDDYTDLQALAWQEDGYDDAIVDTSDLCDALRSFCAKAGDCWNIMTMTIRRDGSFEVEYSYDAIPDFNARVIRDWQSQYLE